MWGNLVSTAEPRISYVSRLPGTLISNALYWWLNGSGDGILEFDLDSQSLAVIKSSPVTNIHSGRSRIIRAEDGGVGFVILSNSSFQMWDWTVDFHGVATWVLWKTVKMHEILGLRSRIQTGKAAVLGYSEDADAIIISVYSYAFMVQLESMQARKLCGRFLENTYHPFTYSSTAGSASARITAPAIQPPKQWAPTLYHHTSLEPSNFL